MDYVVFNRNGLSRPIIVRNAPTIDAAIAATGLPLGEHGESWDASTAITIDYASQSVPQVVLTSQRLCVNIKDYKRWLNTLQQLDDGGLDLTVQPYDQHRHSTFRTVDDDQVPIILLTANE